MPFVKKLNEDFIISNDVIKLTEKYMTSARKFKKITGSRFGAVLSFNPFCSPFKTWCIMTNIFVEEMDDTFMKAGSIIEPKIHQLVCQKLNVNYKQYNPAEVKWDVFSSNPIFGGIPDGEPVDQYGKLLYPQSRMLEIKTASIDSYKYTKKGNDFILVKDENNKMIVKNPGEKRAKWFDANNEIVIPEEYKFQLGLYCYLRNITKGLFAVCFLETKDYEQPELCDVNQRELHLVEFDIDLDEFKPYITYAEKWYQKHIINGISPKMSEQDKEWLKNEVVYDQ